MGLGLAVQSSGPETAQAQFPEPSGPRDLLPQQGLDSRTPDVVGHRIHLVHGGLHVEAANDILGIQLVQVEGDSCDS